MNAQEYFNIEDERNGFIKHDDFRVIASGTLAQATTISLNPIPDLRGDLGLGIELVEIPAPDLDRMPGAHLSIDFPISSSKHILHRVPNQTTSIIKENLGDFDFILVTNLNNQDLSNEIPLRRFEGTLNKIDEDNAHITLIDEQDRELSGVCQADRFLENQILENDKFILSVIKKGHDIIINIKKLDIQDQYILDDETMNDLNYIVDNLPEVDD